MGGWWDAGTAGCVEPRTMHLPQKGCGQRRGPLQRPPGQWAERTLLKQSLLPVGAEVYQAVPHWDSFMK